MGYTPTRIYVKLAPDAAKALGRRAKEKQIDDPRRLAADLIRQALDLTPLCPQCDNPTIADPERSHVHFCPFCNEPVHYSPPGDGKDGSG